MTRRRRAGFTLLETLLVVALLGVLAGMVAFRWTHRPQLEPVTATQAAVASARTAAIATGRRQTVTVADSASGRTHTVTALPDGSVLAPAALTVHRMHGRTEAR